MRIILNKSFPYWEGGCRLVTYPEGENDLPEDVARMAISLGYAESETPVSEEATSTKGKKKQ